MEKLLGETQSLCPSCLRLIQANKIIENENVYLEKSCPEHGYYKTLLWRDAELYQEWGNYGVDLGSPKKRQTDTIKGCFYDCGLCPEHKAETCVALMEVTHQCNLNCPVCFSSSGENSAYNPTIDVIRGMYETVFDSASEKCPIQLSGGEPTVRDDLPQIISIGKDMGFGYIQINTNGIRIAKDIDYLYSLKKSGASSIFLQFDGVTDEVYLRTRDRGLYAIKRKAVENCAEVGIGVILVPTLIPGVNVHHIGRIIEFAKSWIPIVKSVHFQPVSYFGRYPSPPGDEDRVTMSDVLFELERQTQGKMKVENFVPRRRKESYCSFGGFFILTEDNELVAASSSKQSRAEANTACQPKEEPYERARRYISERWRLTEVDSRQSEIRAGTWESFFDRAKTHYLSVTCMPFQDVWNIDLDRLQRCCTHVVTPDKRIIPLCSFYLTDTQGRRLHSIKMR